MTRKTARAATSTNPWRPRKGTCEFAVVKGDAAIEVTVIEALRPCQPISLSSQVRANSQSRFTVATEISKASAVSLSVRPPK